LVTRWLPEALEVGFQMSPIAASLTAYTAILIAVGLPCGFLTLGYAYASRHVSRFDLPLVGTFFWVMSEWVRSQLLGWELLGHTQFRELWLIQIADLGGVFAVSFIVALISIAVAEMLGGLASRAIGVAGAARTAALPTAALAITFVYGMGARATYTITPAEMVAPTHAFETYDAPLVPVSYSPAAAPARAPSALPELRVRQVATIEQNGVRVGPLLCEDLLDTHLIHSVVADGADVLINNCRVPWLAAANTGAADQHLALAVFRSVESRRFLVRSTNHGDGELVTAGGETLREPPSGQSLTISSGSTRYMHYGNRWLLLGFGMALIVVGRGKRD
jgi:apolipoprotein N-acyltransferase